MYATFHAFNSKCTILSLAAPLKGVSNVLKWISVDSILCLSLFKICLRSARLKSVGSAQLSVPFISLMYVTNSERAIWLCQLLSFSLLLLYLDIVTLPIV